GLADAQHYRLADWRGPPPPPGYRRGFSRSPPPPAPRGGGEGVRAPPPVCGRAGGGGGGGAGGGGSQTWGARPPALRARAGCSAWVACEKILIGAEELPADWKCAGTTGYDALGRIGGVFLDPAGAGPLTAGYTKFTGGTASFAPVAEAAKREVIRGSLGAEVR